MLENSYNNISFDYYALPKRWGLIFEEINHAKEALRRSLSRTLTRICNAIVYLFCVFAGVLIVESIPYFHEGARISAIEYGFIMGQYEALVNNRTYISFDSQTWLISPWDDDVTPKVSVASVLKDISRQDKLR